LGLELLEEFFYLCNVELVEIPGLGETEFEVLVPFAFFSFITGVFLIKFAAGEKVFEKIIVIGIFDKRLKIFVC
jgi:hypothetical protein